MRFNVLLTTIGRNNLHNMFFSLKNQLSKDDFLTIVSDKNHEASLKTIGSHLDDFKCRIHYIANQSCLGYWGHASRNEYQNTLQGDYILNADDDNIYLDGAFDKIREVVKEKKLYIFKHTNQHTTIWHTEGKIIEGNIDTSCGVIPNTGKLPTWDYFYGGDGAFYKKLAMIMPYEFVDYKISTFFSSE